jgi:antitoxin HigA-1
MIAGAFVLNFARVTHTRSKSSTIIEVEVMAPVVHPGRLLKRELGARKLSANRLSLDIGVPSGRITDILNERRAITADTAVRLGRYFGNSAQFWLDLQGQYDIGVVEREKGAEIAARVRPADAA